MTASAASPGSAPARAGSGLVYHGSSGSKKVALTFDLCEVPSSPAGFDRRLVDVLLAQRVPATFMMGGHWAETHPAEARSLGDTSFFEIGNHSYAHRHPTRISPAEFREEIERAQQAIAKATGRTPTVFRFPYGEHDEATVAEVWREGLAPIQWSVETGDPDPNVSASDILREVEHRTKGGSIVIMHANGRGRHTAEALPKVIAWLRSHGYEPVTISELLDGR